MSYIAKIETVEIVETWKQLFKTIQLIRGKNWLNKHKEFLMPTQKNWDREGNRKASFLFLGPPRLVFNPPVKKECLQKGKGWLSKRFLSFDDLFSALEGKMIDT